MEALRQVRFDMIFSFIYSPRKGTPAATMKDQISKEIQNARFERLLALQQQISQAANDPMVGQTVRILCDGVSKNDPSRYSGRTEGGKIVFFEGTEEDRGRFLYVRIDRAEPFALYGAAER
jgi:tRNA-2-methylthio-N6-dimethylallyladenosine synthase